jgi:hypothetical protein
MWLGIFGRFVRNLIAVVLVGVLDHGDGRDRTAVEGDDDAGGDLDPELALAGLLDDRVHPARGDDLVPDDDIVLHRRVRPLAAAPGHGQGEPAEAEQYDDDDYRSDVDAPSRASASRL